MKGVYFIYLNIFTRDKRKLDELRQMAAKKEEEEGPEQFRIYTGKVQNITNFGCFVSLEGFGR